VLTWQPSLQPLPPRTAGRTPPGRLTLTFPFCSCLHSNRHTLQVSQGRGSKMAARLLIPLFSVYFGYHQLTLEPGHSSSASLPVHCSPHYTDMLHLCTRVRPHSHSRTTLRGLATVSRHALGVRSSRAAPEQSLCSAVM